MVKKGFLWNGLWIERKDFSDSDVADTKVFVRCQSHFLYVTKHRVRKIFAAAYTALCCIIC